MNSKADKKLLAQRLEEYKRESGKSYAAIASEMGEDITVDNLRHLRKHYTCGPEKYNRIAWYLGKPRDTTIAIEVEEESTVDAMIKALQSREESANPEGMTALTHEAREIVTSMSEKTGRTYKDCASALIEYAAKILKRYGKVLMD